MKLSSSCDKNLHYFKNNFVIKNKKRMVGIDMGHSYLKVKFKVLVTLNRKVGTTLNLGLLQPFLTLSQP